MPWLEKAALMNDLDRERITTLIGEAKKALGQLHRHAAEAEVDLLTSEVKLGNIKYQFIVAIESCIDICTHVAARSYSRVPESYAGCFDLLLEGQLIKADLSMQMSDFARFRNILVHGYWEVNNRRVIEKLKNDLEYIEDFLRTAAALAESH
jgi:uncharacterized protein YutE (UPF0331/DUF86 family)